MLTGASYGGYLTLQAAIEYNDRIRCAYEAAGMTNLVAFLEETDPSRQAERRPEYGDERDPQMRAFLTSISPMTRAAEFKKPVVHHSPIEGHAHSGGPGGRLRHGRARERHAGLVRSNTPTSGTTISPAPAIQRLQFLLLGPVREDLSPELTGRSKRIH